MSRRQQQSGEVIGRAHHGDDRRVRIRPPELAPATELRRLQYAEDDRRGVGKRSRHELAAEYARRYTTEILDRADLAPLVSCCRGHMPRADT